MRLNKKSEEDYIKEYQYLKSIPLDKLTQSDKNRIEGLKLILQWYQKKE
jgi:hypothetical protein